MYSKQKSLNFGNYVPNDKALNKKIPENPKYKHVKPAIDTGKNIRRHIDELREKLRNCNHKKDEVFKRIKVSNFLRLAIASAIEMLNTENQEEDARNAESSKFAEPVRNRAFANVLMGVGELDVVQERKAHSAPSKLEKTLPYLLLDVRDKDAYFRTHVITAKNFPAARLSRSIGCELDEMKFYKNKPNIIILYDEDEIIAVRVASTLVERGYDNIYVLTGGLKHLLEVCPQNLIITGSYSPLLMVKPTTSARAQHSYPKEYFSKEDVDKLQNFMDAHFELNSNCSWSTISQSTKSTISSRLKSTNNRDNASVVSSVASTRKGSTCSCSTSEQASQFSTCSQDTKTSVRTRNSKYTDPSRIGRTVPQPIDVKPKASKKAPWK